MGHKSMKPIKISTTISTHQLFTKVLLQINHKFLYNSFLYLD